MTIINDASEKQLLPPERISKQRVSLSKAGRMTVGGRKQLAIGRIFLFSERGGGLYVGCGK